MKEAFIADDGSEDAAGNALTDLLYEIQNEPEGPRHELGILPLHQCRTDGGA
ncbi:MAG TPA: hypothetical protein PLZ36_09030 [Armatimonadota bacterium]|nr:hypothetical protein [Armatimonadota bacterium]